MKNLLKNNRYAVFIILTFLIYVMSNGEWCIPIFAWIYPILFLHMLSLNHTRKAYLIVGSIYAIGFVSKTAIVRGVENGSNIIRHTNNGMSIVSNVKGCVLAQTDYFQSDTKTLSAQVSMKGRFTLYSYIGNLFVYLCNLYLLGSFILLKIIRLIKR